MNKIDKKSGGKLNKRSILVTGCTGLLGSNLCYLLNKDDYDVVGTSRGVLSMSGVEWLQGDICSTRFAKEIMQVRKFDAVIHCAALTNVDQCEEDPGLAMRVNCDAAIRLAEAAAASASKFIFISTDAVFSGEKKGAYTELDHVDPVNVYGESKVRVENALQSFDDALVLRTNMYGFNYLEKSSFSEWVLSSLRKGVQLRMFEDVRFSALLVNDLADRIRRAFEADLRGVYHLASSDSLTKFEFGNELARMVGVEGAIKPVSVGDMQFSARRSKNMALDASKISDALGAEMPAMCDGIAKYVQLEKDGYPAMLKGRV